MILVHGAKHIWPFALSVFAKGPLDGLLCTRKLGYFATELIASARTDSSENASRSVSPRVAADIPVVKRREETRGSILGTRQLNADLGQWAVNSKLAQASCSG